MKKQNKVKQSEEKSRVLDKAKDAASRLINSVKDPLVRKKNSGERTRSRYLMDRVGLHKAPNTIKNGGKVAK